MRRLALPLAGIIFSTLIFLPVVRAEDTPQPGIQMTVYNGFPDPNYQPWVEAPITEPCFDGVVPEINADWGGGPAAEGCDADFFLVHYSGWITVPESGAYEFLALVDDGWRMTINGQLVNDNWVLKGCGGWWSGPNEGFIELTAGISYPLDAWMYEWGGGACAILWYGGPTGYDVVPAAWLTTNALPAVEPSPSPSELPSPEPSVEPSQEASVEPTSTPTESATVQPSPNPTPTQEPTNEPTPTSEPTPTATPEPSPTPEPTPVPPTPIPPVPSPTPVPSASPSPEPSVTPPPSEVPSVPPTPEPTPVPDNIGAQTVAAIGQAIEAITNLGKDLSPAEKKKAAPVAVAIVISQVASAAVAAASSAARKVEK